LNTDNLKPQPAPPEALPEGYREIWEALAAIDAESPSRQALAQRVGLSTHTIQRILVRGDVPRFPETVNTRIRRAWARIMTRLAFHLGYQPRRWIEAIGIPWDEETRKASDSALRRLVSRQAGEGREPLPRASAGIPPLPGVYLPDLKRIGIVTRPHLSEQLSGYRGSFLEVYAGRLLKAIAPASDLSFRILTEQEAISGLTDSKPTLDLAVGLVETVYRRSLGLEFLTIPGWAMRYKAITIRRASDRRELPAWSEVVRDPDRANALFITPGDDVTAYFLAGQCGIQPERLLVQTASAPAEIARVFHREVERRPEARVILVTDEADSARVRRDLEQIEGFSGNFTVKELRAADGEYPAYRLGIGLRPGAGGWLELLEAARDDEVFGSSLGRTAQIYSALLASGLSGAGWPGGPADARPSTALRLADFSQATDAFREIVCRDLLEYLRSEIAQGLPSLGDPTVQSGAGEAVMLAALARAEQVLPPTWLKTLRAVALQPAGTGVPRVSGKPAKKVGVGVVGHCRSCSVSLGVPHNRGVSDRYCRFCSDEQGHLKPRDQVQRLIAQWFKGWQGDLSRDEAMRRAGLFMQAMPAWCNN
jgi:hypothetical protein